MVKEINNVKDRYICPNSESLSIVLSQHILAFSQGSDESSFDFGKGGWEEGDFIIGGIE